MAEIKMNAPDLREIASALRYLEGREEECSSNRRKWGEIAAAIEEQVKPAIEEPTEFGSIVRAGYPSQPPHTESPLWQHSPMHGRHYWESEYGAVEVWSELTDVEVLRVGLGDVVDIVSIAIQGYSDAKSDALAKLRVQRSEAITSERKNALEKAIQAVEELAP